MRHQMRFFNRNGKREAVQAGLHGELPTDDGVHWCAPRNFTTSAPTTIMHQCSNNPCHHHIYTCIVSCLLI
jgi:hypothetical protein